MKDSDYHPIYSEPLFNNKLFPVIIIDDKGTITDCNQKTADTFGIQKPQLIGTSAKDLFLSESALHPVASTAEVSALTRDKKILHFEYTFEKVSLPEHGKSHGYIILSEKPVPEIKDEDLDSLSRKIFEPRTVGFTLLNDELKVIKINDAILKLLGFEPTEVVNKHIHSLGVLGTKASDESELIWKKIREAGSMKNIERQLISKTGKAITLQVSIDHFYLDDKRYWIITSNDISMKKESDLYLQNAFQKLAHHLNNSPLGIVEYDNHLIVTEWSSQSENIFKWSKAEILNNNIGAFNLIYEEDIEATTKIAEELLSGKVSGNISYNRNYTKDGDIIHCVWYNSAVKNENGEVISIMSLVQDVTASKQLEQELINSKKELELFFSNSIYGFFFMMLDKPVIWNDQVNKEDVLEYVFDHQRITKINQAMLDQYKASYEDLIGLTPRDFFEHDIEAGKQSWISLFDHGKLRIDTHEKRFDGSDFWVEGDYKLLRNEKNEIIGHFGIQHDITEKKKALYKLEESERNFRILFNNASDGIFITDGEGNLIDVNEGACHMTGFSKSELVHMHVRSILSPECLASQELKFSDLNEGKKILLQRTAKRKNGETFPIEVSAKQVDKNRIQAIVRDISERKEVEDNLREREQLLREVGSIAKIGAWKMDPDTDTCTWSPEVAIIHRQPHTSIIKKEQWLSLLEEKSKSVFEQSMHSVLTSGESMNCELELATTDPVRQFVRMIIQPVKEKDEVAGLKGTLQDISEQKRFQQEVYVQKELSDKILNSLPGVFYLYNKEGQFYRWNKNFEIVTGYTPEEIRNLDPLQLFDISQHALLKSKIENVFVSGEDSVEADFLLKNGKKIPYFFTGTAIYYNNEECLMGVGIDISDRVRAQHSLLETNKQLYTAQQIAKIGYWEWDRNRGNIHWSNQIYKICGIDPVAGPLSEIEFGSLIHPDDKRDIISYLNQIEEKGTQQEAVFRFKKGQDWIYLKAMTSLVYDKSGTFKKLEGTLQDVTEMKSNEEALKTSNERYELIAKATNDAIWDWNIKTNKITGNLRLQELYELQGGDEMDDELFFSKVHPEDVKALRLSISDALRQSNPSTIDEFRLINPDGEYSYMLSKAYIIFDEQSYPIRILGAMQDITDWKLAEKEHRELSNRLMLATNSAQLGVFDWDIAKNTMVWNKFMYDIYDVSPNQLLLSYEEWMDCLYPRDAIEFDSQVKNVLKEGSNLYSRFRIVSTNNVIRHVEAHALVIRDARQRPVSMIGVSRDITESINTEKILAKKIIQTQEEERFEIGQELHDNVIQLLVAAQINLSYEKSTSTDANPTIDNAFRFIGSSIDEIRRLSHRLAPASINEKPIEETLHKLLHSINVNNRFEINFETDITDDVEVSEEVKLTLYRILQEELNNILKHSKATRLEVVFKVNEFRIYLQTTDNGRGFDINKVPAGIGLNNIRRRTELFNGNMHIQSAPMHGCQITIQLPLEGNSEHQEDK